MQWTPEMRRCANRIYDQLAGITVEEQREIFHDVQRMVNARCVIPARVPAQYEGPPEADQADE